MPPTKSEKLAVLDIAVSYGNVSIGDKTGSIGLTVDRRVLSTAKAEKHFCGKRVESLMIGMPKDEAEGQGHFDGMDDSTELTGIADVKGFSVTPKHLTLRLTFNLEDTDLGLLCSFAKRIGRLIVQGVADIPEKEAAEDDDEDDDEDDE